jgi:hypothetical protein
MRHGDWLLTGALAALAAGVALAALALMGFAFRVEWLLAAGLIILSVAQIANIISRRREFSGIRENLAQMQAAGRQDSERRAKLAQRLEELESRPPPPRGETQSLADEVKALRSTLRGISEKQARRATREPRFASAPATAPTDGFSPDKLDLYLEPIVNLDGNATAHYHASVELRAGDGRRVSAASLMSEAESSGMRPALDRFAYLPMSAVSALPTALSSAGPTHVYSFRSAAPPMAFRPNCTLSKPFRMPTVPSPIRSSSNCRTAI